MTAVAVCLAILGGCQSKNLDPELARLVLDPTRFPQALPDALRTECLADAGINYERFDVDELRYDPGATLFMAHMHQPSKDEQGYLYSDRLAAYSAAYTFPQLLSRRPGESKVYCYYVRGDTSELLYVAMLKSDDGRAAASDLGKVGLEICAKASGRRGFETSLFGCPSR